MVAAVSLAACGPASTTPEAKSQEQSSTNLPKVPLTILSNGKQHKFVVEVPETTEQEEKGLMFRKAIAPNEGMLFGFVPPRPVTLWMKDMLVPLDMLFIGPNGRISSIHENAVPMSLDPIVSTDPVIAVLEIPGGRSAALGIAPGDAVEWPH